MGSGLRHGLLTVDSENTRITLVALYNEPPSQAHVRTVSARTASPAQLSRPASNLPAIELC